MPGGGVTGPQAQMRLVRTHIEAIPLSPPFAAVLSD